MKPAGIEKNEIMLLLTEMNNQLEQLEADMHSSIEQFQNEWYTSQIDRLETCGEKLTALENKVNGSNQGVSNVGLSYPVKKVSALELGY